MTKYVCVTMGMRSHVLLGVVGGAKMSLHSWSDCERLVWFSWLRAWTDSVFILPIVEMISSSELNYVSCTRSSLYYLYIHNILPCGVARWHHDMTRPAFHNMMRDALVCLSLLIAQCRVSPMTFPGDV